MSFKQGIWLWIVLLAMIHPVYAADIAWGNPLQISGTNDVINFLETQEAWNLGGKTNLLINGVSFKGSSEIADNQETYEGFTPTPTFPEISGEYQLLLNTAIYQAAYLTLKGLTPGKYYTVQIWSTDTRDFVVEKKRTTALSGGSGKEIQLKQSFDNAGQLGQFVLGVFKADSTTQRIDVLGLENGNVEELSQVVNALVLYKGSLTGN